MALIGPVVASCGSGVWTMFIEYQKPTGDSNMRFFVKHYLLALLKGSVTQDFNIGFWYQKKDLEKLEVADGSLTLSLPEKMRVLQTR